jgi:CheY-like chemotaxis protein
MTGQAAPLVSAPLASAPFVSAVSEESSPEPVADQDDKPIHEPVQASSESTIAPQAASEKPRSSSGKKREQNPREENLKQESLFPLDDTAEGNVAEEKVATVRVTPARAEANEPLRAEPRELPPQPPKEERSSPKRRLLSILVVDDSEANRDIMDHMIKSYGHKLDLAASGEDALALCKTQSYDIVFMDCFMPGLDGYKTTQEIRSESSSADARIIGMSARLGEQELRRCLDAGMDDLLAKPFTLKEVGEIIQKYASSPAPR